MEMIIWLVIAIAGAIAVWMAARHHHRLIDGRDVPRPDIKKDRPDDP
jgi:hypothetical protein